MRKVIALLIIVLIVGCSRSNDDMIQDLYSSNSNTRRASAAKLMLRTGDNELVVKLNALLEGDDEQITFIVTQILGSLSDPDAVDPLGKLIKHPNKNIRARACWSLGTIGHDSALDYLIKGLEDEEGDVRYAAVVALGHLHYTPSVPYLYPMLRDVEDSIRVRAIQSLYYYRLDENAHILGEDFASVLNDKSDVVRYVAAQALGGAWEDVRGWVYRDSTVSGDLLIESLSDKNKNVRIETIKSLKKLRFQKAVSNLKQMYDLSSVDEEAAISEAILEITGEKYPPSLNLPDQPQP